MLLTVAHLFARARVSNVHLQAPTLGQLASIHLYGWKAGMYYLRTRPAAQFTADQSLLKEVRQQKTHAAKTMAQANGIPTPISSPASSAVVPRPQSSQLSSNKSQSLHLWLPLLTCNVAPTTVCRASYRFAGVVGGRTRQQRLIRILLLLFNDSVDASLRTPSFSARWRLRRLV